MHNPVHKLTGGFILGSARCGSTLVSDILRLHPAILSLSELFSTVGPNAFRPDQLTGETFWRNLSKPSRALSQIGNPDSAPNEFLYGRVKAPAHDPWFCPPILAITLPHLSQSPDALFAQLASEVPQWNRKDVGDQYRALFQSLANSQGGKQIWVERSGGSLVAAKTLLDMFPEARPVLLLRNGPDTVLSMRDYPATRVAIWMWRHLRPFGIDLLDPQTHYGRGALWPVIERFGGVFGLRSILAKRPSLTDSAAFWSAMMETGLRTLMGRDLMVLSYEELCAAPRQEITHLGQYLLGDAPEAWVAAASQLPEQRPSKIATLTTKEREALYAGCARGELAIREFQSRRASSRTDG